MIVINLYKNIYLRNKSCDFRSTWIKSIIDKNIYFKNLGQLFQLS